jgi:pyruvate ferredoxin oxidoreductase gamma subunit
MKMFQARLHGRGGQGVVTAAEMLSVAAFFEGKHAQAFPSFGSERMGAPVVSFCRISEQEIRLREPVLQPDLLIIQDPTLLHSVDVFSGIAADGWVLINTSKSLADMHIGDLVDKLPRGHVQAVAATELAIKHIGRPLPNAVMLGGTAALTGIIKLQSVIDAIHHAFPGAIGEANAAAAKAAYEAIASVRKETVAC